MLAQRFPHFCAHRGLSLCCPENTLPAFGAAIAVGVSEIEFDLWLSADGVPVVCHDATVDRTTEGKGTISDLSWAEIRRLDAGCRMSEQWRKTRVPCLQEVVELAKGKTCLNIHIKQSGSDDLLIRKVYQTLCDQGLVDAAYLAGEEKVLEAAQHLSTDMERACLAGQNEPARQIDIALQYGCRRAQFGRQVGDHEISRARQAGLICNLYYSDTPQEAAEYFQRGIDVVLTNCAHQLVNQSITARP